MDINEIENPELKNKINMIYLFEENHDEKSIEKTHKEISKYIQNNKFLTVLENNKLVKIPYGNDNEFVIPIFTDAHEYKRGMEYFELNDMDRNKKVVISSINKYKKVKEDPNFLGLLVNIASVSYIINNESF